MSIPYSKKSCMKLLRLGDVRDFGKIADCFVRRTMSQPLHYVDYIKTSPSARADIPIMILVGVDVGRWMDVVMIVEDTPESRSSGNVQKFRKSHVCANIPDNFIGRNDSRRLGVRRRDESAYLFDSSIICEFDNRTAATLRRCLFAAVRLTF